MSSGVKPSHQGPKISGRTEGVGIMDSHKHGIHHCGLMYLLSSRIVYSAAWSTGLVKLASTYSPAILRTERLWYVTKAISYLRGSQGVSPSHLMLQIKKDLSPLRGLFERYHPRSEATPERNHLAKAEVDERLPHKVRSGGSSSCPSTHSVT